MFHRLSVAAFAGGRSVPGARFRVRQYIPSLSGFGIDVEELPNRFGKFPPPNQMIRPLWLGATLCEQAVNFTGLGKYDLVLLQREIISKLVTFERWSYRPILLDVDDAIFLFRDGYVARRLAEYATVIVCGNTYLAEWFSKWNENVKVIPTPVDTERYRPVDGSATGDAITIGWIGTSGNLAELSAIAEPLKTVMTRFPTARLRVVCDRPPSLPGLSSAQVDYIQWNEETEVGSIQGMDIGIMPLRDTPWTRGKCSFKMIQYMSCGLPSVVSATGMNAEVARMGNFSVAVRSAAEWVGALSDLLVSAESRRRMGRAAREIAEKAFSVRALAPKMASALRGAM